MDHDIFTIGQAGSGAEVGTGSGVGVGLGAPVGVGVWRECRSRARAFPTTASFSCLQQGRGVTGCSIIPFASTGTTPSSPPTRLVVVEKRAPSTRSTVKALGLLPTRQSALLRKTLHGIHGKIDQSSRPLRRVSLGLRETTTGAAQIGPGSHPAARRSLTAFGSETCPRPTTGPHRAVTSAASHLYGRRTSQHEQLDFIIIVDDPEMIFFRVASSARLERIRKRTIS
ncbi:hypothetical protein INS49_001644 [Diaporthe citri]|uniref:uncharacterized protein n=1 Tax=Diaporthe citri TaxID=83186 RepID=UPI001C80C4C5|nr:uncharacterized protein INS49_001644 [Diaporthe citri]KAG6367455.1 hypothetical protein INS49_001644 [Diaporthe citri]